jgi:hypothetical protein
MKGQKQTLTVICSASLCLSQVAEPGVAEAAPVTLTSSAGTPAASEPAQRNQPGPHHIRLQGLSQAVPMRSNTGAATDWDFSKLDGGVAGVLSVADHSPNFK